MIKILDDWTDSEEPSLLRARLVPNRSLDRHGTKIVAGIIAVAFCFPLSHLSVAP